MKRTLLYKFVYCIGRLAFPRAKTVRESGEPDSPGIYVCNHAGIRGPAMMTLYYERPHRTWTISYTLDRSKCANFAFHDFFCGESRKHKGAWRVLSKAVGFIMPRLFASGDVIPLYHDKNVVKTVRQTLSALENGEDVVIFAESPVRFSEYVHELQTGFADIGYLYHLKTGKKLKFYPVYVEKKNRAIAVASPVEYDPSVPMREQRAAIASAVRDGIDRMARGLGEHKPVPFLPERWYKAYGKYENDLNSYWKLFE